MFNNIVRDVIKMIYITFDTSIVHNTTLELIVETWKIASYDTHAVLYSITHDGHVQIHILMDT